MEQHADTEISKQNPIVDNILKSTRQDSNVHDIRGKEEIDYEGRELIEDVKVNEIQFKEEAVDGSGDQWRPSASDAAETSVAEHEREAAAAGGASEAAGGCDARPPRRSPVSAVRALATLGVHGLLALLFADILVGRPLQNTVGITARFWAVGCIVGCVMLVTAAGLAYRWRPCGVVRPANFPRAEETQPQQLLAANVPTAEERQPYQQLLPPANHHLLPADRQLPQTSGLLRIRSAPELKVLFFIEAEQPTSSGDSLGITV